MKPLEELHGSEGIQVVGKVLKPWLLPLTPKEGDHNRKMFPKNPQKQNYAIGLFLDGYRRNY